MKNLPEFLRNPDPQIYLSDNYITLDFETTNKDKGSALQSDNKLVLSVWKAKGAPVCYSSDSEYAQEPLLESIESADFVVAHNAKFELQWLARCGLDLSTVLVYDTMIGEYVLGGNRWKFPQLSLDKLAAKYGAGSKGGLVSSLIKAGVCPSDIPYKWLLEYCVQDVNLTEQIFLRQRKTLAKQNKLAVQYTRCLLTPVLADIEKNGMFLSKERVEEEYKDVMNNAATLEARLSEFSDGVNWNSPAQVADYVYDELGFKELRGRDGKPIRTAGGRRSASADTLPLLKAKNKKQKRFMSLYLAAKDSSNRLTKYLTKFLSCCNDAGGILIATFNQMATYTHRLSSSGSKYKTQFQNFPRMYKRLFMARNEGWMVGETDGSQLEFRVAVHLGRDPVGLKDIEDDVDVHAFSADIIFGSLEYRQEAKKHTFKPLYGGSSGTKKEQEYYKFFKDRYKGITATQQRWIDSVLKDKSLITEWGLEYFWPNTRISNDGYVSNTTSICNYPVQGFATAEIIPIALVYFWHRIKIQELKMFIVNTIHDSIITELPPEEEKYFRELSKQCMVHDVYRYLSDVYGIKFTAPLGCETKVGKYWGTGKEEKYNAPRNLYT